LLVRNIKLQDLDRVPEEEGIMKKKIIILFILLISTFCFNNVEAEAGKIFLVLKDAKLYKNANVDKDYLTLNNGNAYEIDNTYKDKNKIFIKLKLKGSSYTFVERENGVEKEFGSWPISIFEQPKPLTPQDQKAREEVEKKYDELMDQAWGGKQRYTIPNDPSAGRRVENKQIHEATKEFVCKEAVRQAMGVYYLNPSAFRVKPTPETWQSEYEKCLKR
jgi:hypothetical protein